MSCPCLSNWELKTDPPLSLSLGLVHSQISLYTAFYREREREVIVEVELVQLNWFGQVCFDFISHIFPTCVPFKVHFVWFSLLGFSCRPEECLFFAPFIFFSFDFPFLDTTICGSSSFCSPSSKDCTFVFLRILQWVLFSKVSLFDWCRFCLLLFQAGCFGLLILSFSLSLWYAYSSWYYLIPFHVYLLLIYLLVCYMVSPRVFFSFFFDHFIRLR